MLPADLHSSLEQFRHRALPGLVRKYQVWQGLNPSQQQEVVEESTQELWLDCLSNTEELVRLDHGRRCSCWFRLLERRHYHLYTKSQRQTGQTPEEPDHVATTGPGETHFAHLDRLGLAGSEQCLAQELLEHAAYLRNGRINCRLSAQRLGISPQALTRRWDQLVSQLGYGREFLDFWQRRLVEALLGLAADLLRDQGSLRLWAEARRRRPDPGGRMRRVLSIRRRLCCRPLPPLLRQVLSRYPRSREGLRRPPRAILADARLLSPLDARISLWSVEAALQDRDHPRALRELRSARHQGADPVATSLARARLLQLRGRITACHRLLDATSRRLGPDPRLIAALRLLQPDSSAAMRSASRASMTGDPVTGVHTPVSPRNSR